MEVLDAECRVVAAFLAAAVNEPDAVAEAPGLEVTIEPWGWNVTRWNTPEVKATEEQGGDVLAHR